MIHKKDITDLDKINAYLLIKKYEDGTEEYIAKKIWECNHSKDTENSNKWRIMLEAVKFVRKVISKVEKNH